MCKKGILEIGVPFYFDYDRFSEDYNLSSIQYLAHNRVNVYIEYEGINNKIKVLKRKTYGFRDTHYFKLRIYALHESRYALIG